MVKNLQALIFWCLYKHSSQTLYIYIYREREREREGGRECLIRILSVVNGLLCYRFVFDDGASESIISIVEYDLDH